MTVIVCCHLKIKSKMAAHSAPDLTERHMVASDINSTSGCTKVKTKDYFLNITKAFKKKLRLNNDQDMSIDIKNGGECIVLQFNTAQFESLRKSVKARYWHGLKNNVCQKVVWTEHKDSSNFAVVQDHIQLWDGDIKLVVINIYRTNNKLMVQGKHAIQWLFFELPVIKENLHSGETVNLDFFLKEMPQYESTDITVHDTDYTETEAISSTSMDQTNADN